jgi:hypothetical protein
MSRPTSTEKIMNRKLWGDLAGVCVLVLAALVAVPALAQEVKEKPPMYSYVSNWAIPRAQWAEMEKTNADEQKILDAALAKGSIVGYGNDKSLLHQPDGGTHDDWWSGLSLGAILNVLDQFYKAGTPTNPVLSSATKHWDSIYVSKYYNWHPGTYKDVYTHVSVYKLKPDASDDALDNLSKNLVVPLMEKMLATGNIHEYEIDTQAIHTDAPGTFVIVYIAANAEALDKVQAAVRQSLKDNPMAGPAFGSATESSAHRDDLLRTNATFK